MGMNENEFEFNVQLNMKHLSHNRIPLTKSSSWTSCQATKMLRNNFVGPGHNALIIATRNNVQVCIYSVNMLEKLVLREEHVGATLFQRIPLGVGQHLMTNK